MQHIAKILLRFFHLGYVVQHASIQQYARVLQQQKRQIQESEEQRHRYPLEQLRGSRSEGFLRPLNDLTGRAAEWIISLHLKSLNIIHTVKHLLCLKVDPAEREHITLEDPLPPVTPVAVAGQGHALQDYQMQLIQLEQQNKKQLLMAEQGKDHMDSEPRPLPSGPFFFVPLPSEIIYDDMESMEDRIEDDEGYIKSPDGTLAAQAVGDRSDNEDGIDEL